MQIIYEPELQAEEAAQRLWPFEDPPNYARRILDHHRPCVEQPRHNIREIPTQVGHQTRVPLRMIRA
jgi:hypothetical protein